MTVVILCAFCEPYVLDNWSPATSKRGWNVVYVTSLPGNRADSVPPAANRGKTTTPPAQAGGVGKLRRRVVQRLTGAPELLYWFGGVGLPGAGGV